MFRRLVFLATVVALATAPSVAAVGFSATVPVAVSSTGPTPFGTSSCAGEGLAGQQAHSAVSFNSEVEPFVATDPTDPEHLVGVWQQDRWNDGGSRGIVTGVSTDSGATWTPNTTTRSSFCTGGTVGNGGNFQRSTDPWVTFSPDGTAYLMTLSLSDPNVSADNAMLVMRSTDGGATWGNPTTLIRESKVASLNDKNSMTGDRNDSDYVYAVWDRLEFPNAHARARSVENAFPFKGPVYFSRTTDGGDTWEKARAIFGNGSITQTIGNQIVVLPDLNDSTFEGQLLDTFTWRTLKSGGNVRGFDNFAYIASSDHGATWSKFATVVAKMFSVGVVDPDTGDPVRSADEIADVAVDPASGALYAVWQDARFDGFTHDAIAFVMSTDGGRTWTAPMKVNKTSGTGPNAQAFDPAVHVLPDGTVGVTYYDFRNNSDVTDELETDVFMVHCHAATDDCTDTTKWSETRVTDASFDLRAAPVARGYFLGDYQGLTDTSVSSVAGFVAFFSRANSSSDPSTIYASNVGP